ncbi:MAG: Tex family protein [Chloroflexi bacterium]|nr:Tex family protein [Chloroflexota bacterium]
MSYHIQIANHLNLKATQVEKTIELLEAGNTIPFIARYRKEVTGELDEVEIRHIEEQLGRLKTLDERRLAILKAIEEQGKLTAELQTALQTADTLTALEDLYQPYKKKRQTRADMARQRGLAPLAERILQQPKGRLDLAVIAQAFIGEDVPDANSAWAGARDIIAEQISDHAQIRGAVREQAQKYATLEVTKIDGGDDPKQVYALYYEFSQRVDRLRPHQILAINRGENEKVLRVKLDVPQRDWLRPVALHFLPRRDSALFEQLDMAIHDAAQRLLLPAIERDVRRWLTEKAEAHAIHTFALNLRGLLTQPPLAGQTILAIDPAYRTGCKIAVIDNTGKVVATTAVYPHQPQKKWAEAIKTLETLIIQHQVTLITIGNGTASRETEQLAAEIISRHAKTSSAVPLYYLMVNEAGASVYSASELARAELPDLDVTLRGAVSIGRRAQDPLAELVKIDAKAIGIGLYQHDVDQKMLAHTLDGVVESVVNEVGVDVNSASPALLTYVAGIGPRLAQNMVAYRDEHGRFPDRASFRKVTGLGPKAFEQCAGFLRVREGGNWLDNTAIHPESYPIATKLLAKTGLTGDEEMAARQERLNQLAIPHLAAELQCGEPTLRDIIAQLARPGRDPREDVPPPILRRDVLGMDDLQVGLRLQGTVRNVVDFGAFVDIGVKQDGLLHRRQLPAGLVLTVGDVIGVTIESVEAERGRISLGWAED